MLAAAAAANNQDLYTMATSLGPFALLAVFAVVYFIIHIRVLKGRPGLLGRIGVPILFMMFGYLLTPGTSIANFVPQLVLRLFGSHFTINS